jgi:hypothetical protein
MKHLFIAAILLLLISSTAQASFYSSTYNSANTAIAAVEIEGKGLYNLVVSVQFLRKPYDKGEYTSDEYEELINRLSVEWRGVALKRVLSANRYKITDLSALRASLESAMESLISEAKKKHGVKQGMDVVYSIVDIYLIDPRNE